MSLFETDLESRLHRLADTSVRADDADRLVGHVRRTVRERRLKRLGAFGLGAAAAGVAAAVVLNMGATTRSGSPHADRALGHVPVGSGDGVGTVAPGKPCPGARHARAIADLDTSVPVWAPAKGTRTDAWTCGSAPVLLYGSIQVSYESGWAGVDVAKKWADMVRDYGGSVETVLGRPAYVHAADANGPRNGVMVVVNGQLIRVIADPGVPIGQLVDLANSIELPSSLQR